MKSVIKMENPICGKGKIKIHLPEYVEIKNWDFSKAVYHPQRDVDITNWLCCEPNEVRKEGK